MYQGGGVFYSEPNLFSIFFRDADVAGIYTIVA